MLYRVWVSLIFSADGISLVYFAYALCCAFFEMFMCIDTFSHLMCQLRINSDADGLMNGLPCGVIGGSASNA